GGGGGLGWSGGGGAAGGGCSAVHPAVEEVGFQVLDRRHHQGAVEEIVVLFAGRLGDQQTAVAGRPVQKPAFVLALRIVLGADRVVGAQPAQFQGHPQMAIDLPPCLD